MGPDLEFTVGLKGNLIASVAILALLVGGALSATSLSGWACTAVALLVLVPFTLLAHGVYRVAKAKALEAEAKFASLPQAPDR